MYPLGNIVHAAAIVLLRHIKCIHSLICSTVREIYDSPPRQAEAQTEPGCASQAVPGCQAASCHVCAQYSINVRPHTEAGHDTYTDPELHAPTLYLLSVSYSLSLSLSLQYALLQTVVDACQKKRHCKFAANSKTHTAGDPCSGIRKFVEIAYKCRPCKYASSLNHLTPSSLSPLQCLPPPFAGHSSGTLCSTPTHRHTLACT